MPSSRATQTDPSRLPGVDAARAVAILGVVLGHALVRSLPGRHPYLSSIVLVIPLFLLITSVLFAYRAAHRPVSWLGFYKKRLAIIVPYLIWTVVYVVGPAVVGRQDISIDGPALFGWFVAGEGSPHLWFVPVLIQVYLLLPLLDAAVRRLGRRTILVVLGAGLLYLAGQNAAGWLEPFYAQKTALDYLLPVTVGLWLGRNYDVWKDWWRRFWWGLVPLTLGIWLLAYSPEATSYLPSISVVDKRSVFWVLMSLVIILATRDWAEKVARGGAGSTGMRVAVRLGQISLGVYLVHPMIQRFWTIALGTTSVAPGLLVVSYFGVGLAGSLALVAIIELTPLSPWLLGLPRRQPRSRVGLAGKGDVPIA